MSLEIEIAKLTEAVMLLVSRLDVIENNIVMKDQRQTAPETLQAEKTAKPDITPEPAKENDSVSEKTDLTHQDLVDLCMTLVKKDRSLGPQIKEIIASFDGAKVVGSVKVEQLPELKAKLEALQ